MIIILLLILSCIAAYLYRLGGKKGYNTKFRDAGCPLIALIALWLLAGFKSSYWWAYLLFYGLMFGALTTYWDWITGEDNLYLHGFAIGLAAIPFLWGGIAWYAIIGRAIVLAAISGFLNYYVNKKQIPHSDEIEEYARGFLTIATLPILFL